MNEELVDAIKRAARAATPQNFDSAEIKREGGACECPTCGGEGYVEIERDYCNYDDVALGVQFYGIGREFGAAEAYYRAANPAAVLALIDLIERQAARIAELEAQLANAAENVSDLEGKIAAPRGTSAQIQMERKLTCEQIDGAMAFGYQGNNAPPSDDHWLAPFWKIGRQQAELEGTHPPIGDAAGKDSVDAVRYRKWVSYSGFTKEHTDATLDAVSINEHAAIASPGLVEPAAHEVATNHRGGD